MLRFMRKQIFRTALLLSFLAWPLSALADAPPNVTQLSAHFENGQITVRWGALENIDTYRVYYGQKSILDSNGAYDDFVATSGKNSELILPDLPPYPQVYVGVLAVNANGEESASFVEEVLIDATRDAMDWQAAQADAKGAPSPSRREREETTVGLLSAIPMSHTSVQLTFSAPVQVPADRAIEAFTVIDGQGNPLRLTRLTITGNTVTIITKTQSPVQNYTVQVSDLVTTDPLLGPVFPIDPVRSTATFLGYGGSDWVAPFEATVTPQEIFATVPNVLSSSGAPLLGVLMISGAAAGWKMIKRKDTEQVEAI